jgi:hypothetical protein
MRIAVSFVIGGIVALVLLRQFPSSDQRLRERIGRYQIHPARVLFGSETFDRLFRVDTATGKTWTLMTRTDGKDYWWPVEEPQSQPIQTDPLAKDQRKDN